MDRVARCDTAFVNGIWSRVWMIVAIVLMTFAAVGVVVTSR